MTICLALASAQVGCAQTASEMAEGAAQGAAAPATSRTLAELNQPPNRQRLNQLLSLPALADAGELFGRGLSRGILAVVGGDLRPGQLESMTQSYLSALGEAFERHILPIIERASAATVEASMSAALNDRSRQQVERFAVAVTATVVDAALDTLIARMDDDLGPAIRRMIRDEIGPGMAEAMRQHIGPATAGMLTDDQMQQALADTAQVVGRNSVFGANQGMIEVGQGEPVGGGPMTGFGETLETVLWMLGAAVLVLLLLIVVLGLGLWRIFARSQELTQENKLREEALVGMARAVEAAEETDADIVESVLRDIQDRDGADRLREKLRRAGYRSGTESPD